MNLEGKSALIIGLARSGAAVAKLLSFRGARTTVTDMKPESELTEYVAMLPGRAKKILGGHSGIDPSAYDLAVISPGVPWDADLPSKLRAAGVPLISEVELASRFITAPIIAVTGANGKTTTTTLIGEIMKAAGHRVYVGGNIGAPLSDAVGGDHDWIVAEISSFQLEGVETFRPKISLVLNITPDHMDRHKTMEIYTALKARVFGNQREGDTLILNAEDPASEKLAATAHCSVRHFGFARHSGGGAWLDGDRAMVDDADGRVMDVFMLSDLLIQGRHNVENALAAALATVSAGVEVSVIRGAIRSFKGLSHRMEKVAVINGVTFINDSKGTNADATIKSLAGYDHDVVLIAGGSSKGAEFGALADAVKRHAKGVVLIGQTADAIQKSLEGYAPIKRAGDMKTAVALAAELAGENDTVLLSPACASFDMFKNYEDRGDRFKAAVKELAEETK